MTGKRVQEEVTKKRRRFWWWVWRFLCLVIVAFVLTSSSVSPEVEFDYRLLPIVEAQRYDWLGWEATAILEELKWSLTGRSVTEELDRQKAEVFAFLERQEQIRQLEQRIQGERANSGQPRLASPPQAADSGASLTSLERTLRDLVQVQEEAAPGIERILSSQVAGVLFSEGFGGPQQVWPPVTFRFVNLPSFLIISPRDEISLYRGVYLWPDLSGAERAHLEMTVESNFDVSALVDDVGGIGSWPTMVTDAASLRDLVDIIAHEWTHNYLFFKPLGQRYGESRDLTTMNETVASMVGAEIAGRVLNEFYPELAPTPSPEPSGETELSSDADSEAGEGQVEDFYQAMRRIRLHVDELLARGDVEEAEAYMERERQKLVEMGYNLRRLNQAYFAFHGSYATSPSSVDPIGPWMRQLRSQSGSLKSFVDRVSSLRSLDDLLAALEDTGPAPE